MRKLTIFFMNGCPYCRHAMNAMKELEAEFPGLSSDQIEWIEEEQNADVANQYDYYYVPSVFLGDQKLYECSPEDNYTTIKQPLKKAIEAIL